MDKLRNKEVYCVYVSTCLKQFEISLVYCMRDLCSVFPNTKPTMSAIVQTTDNKKMSRYMMIELMIKFVLSVVVEYVLDKTT